jgi:glycerophosphoryl diester phosphodiesterase
MTMTGRNTWKYLIILLVFFGCSKNQIVLQPDVNIGNVLFVSDTYMKKMEGIYALNSGQSGYGTEWVCKASKYRVSFFSNLSGIFMILKYGIDPSDSSLKFDGFWRFSEDATQGLVNFVIPKAEAVAFLQTGDISTLTLNGNISSSQGSSSPFSLKFSKPFSQYVLTHPFEIYSHHGVQTTSNPPFAQNSLLGVYNDEDYGVDGLEFDVQMTRDNIPICMHDGNIDIRLTQKSPLSGNYTDYSFNFLEDYIRLVDGQKIPSLEQVCTAFIDSTTMTYLWLDIKGDDGIFQALLPIIQNAYSHAQAVGREVVMYVDMPSTTVIGQYQSYPPYRASGLPSMCELTFQDVVDNGCTRWGPRYSRGLMLDEVAQAHAQGIKVISWTLNDKTLIRNYIQNGQFDGFISDYPAYVVYDWYTLK